MPEITQVSDDTSILIDAIAVKIKTDGSWRTIRREQGCDDFFLFIQEQYIAGGKGVNIHEADQLIFDAKNQFDESLWGKCPALKSFLEATHIQVRWIQ